MIDETLEEVDGVGSSVTSLRTGRATVTYDPSRCTPAGVVAAIVEAGYTARPEQP